MPQNVNYWLVTIGSGNALVPSTAHFTNMMNVINFMWWLWENMCFIWLSSSNRKYNQVANKLRNEVAPLKYGNAEVLKFDTD